MRVLLVSQYFPPEAGATQNRMRSFADGLVGRGHDVTVMCEQPCHPGGVFHPGYGDRPVCTERADALTVHRLWVVASPRKTTGRRLAFYASFAAGAAAMVAGMPRHDVLLATSPPLPGVLAVAAAARARRLPFVVDVRDPWPAAAEALGELSNRRLVRLFERAERDLYRHARAVTATTEPFRRHVDRVAGRSVGIHLPNGALDELVALADADPPEADPFVVGYAGNLGIAQGLGIVLDAAERLAHRPVRFELVGAGALANELAAEITRRGLVNVALLPPIPVEQVGAFLQRCHALLVPLRDHPLLADFIPSKLYDAMAVGRPAIVASRGEAAALVRRAEAGVVVDPEDGAALADAVLRLAGDAPLARRLGANGRRAAASLSRSRQLDLLERTLRRAMVHDV